MRWICGFLAVVAACSSGGGGGGGGSDGPLPPLDQIDLFAVERAEGQAAELHAYRFSDRTDWQVPSVTSAHQLFWSPDGATLALVADESASDQGTLSLLHLADGSLTALAATARDDGYTSQVAWSADGAHAAISVGAPARWVVVDVADGTLHEISSDTTRGGLRVAFSPAGHLVVDGRTYCAGDGSACAAVPSGCLRSPDDTVLACNVGVEGVTFTRMADGTQVGAWTNGGTDRGGWAGDSVHFAGFGQTGGAHYLAAGAVSDAMAVELAEQPDAFLWSPDGGHVALRLPQSTTTLAAPDGTGAVAYTQLNWGGGHWLPDGKHYVAQETATGHVVLIAPGDAAARLTDGSVGLDLVYFDDPGDAGVAPDSSAFAYAAGLSSYLCVVATAHCEAIAGGLLDQIAWRDGQAVMKLVTVSASGAGGALVMQPPGGSPMTLPIDVSLVRFALRARDAGH
jgi:hypothetical protein